MAEILNQILTELKALRAEAQAENELRGRYFEALGKQILILAKSNSPCGGGGKNQQSQMNKEQLDQIRQAQEAGLALVDQMAAMFPNNPMIAGKMSLLKTLLKPVQGPKE